MQKEVIGDYEVLASVHVGEKEVVIGEKEPNNDGLRFMCGYMERTDIFNLCNECVYSDDYIEIAHLQTNKRSRTLRTKTRSLVSGHSYY